ncbi:hypothetical protein CCACVL1_25378 [Corchorus capsularis]|uniref:Uncharacterized protein n=1 Tax=Corchorus capsularis TaxID=210143 RepID=A0A1R3GKY4_COCAP|nr:hypothetical protein CCACVL1_25378 [Corchorus capsularis]
MALLESVVIPTDSSLWNRHSSYTAETLR